MKKSRILIGFLVCIILLSLPQLCICQENICQSFIKEPIQMSLSPGEDESIINFSWYSKDTDKPSKMKVYDNKNVRNICVKSINIGNGYVSNKCRVNKLKNNSSYYYSYTIDGEYTKPIEFKTQGKNNYSIILMGDPQIGASYKYKNMIDYECAVKIDSYNWKKALERALNKRKNASFIISLGDETNTTNDYTNKENEKNNIMEFYGYLSPTYLKNIPIVNVIGNHDKNNRDFYYHFNTPNLSGLGSTNAGSNFYFTYDNALILVLNTNNTDVDQHRKFIKEAVNKNTDKKWRIALFHHDIYGYGSHSKDKDVMLFRELLPSILEENKINIVFNGHDHYYSRTYPIYKNEKNDYDGIVYITLGSSTGSKFYKKTDELNRNTAYRFDKKIPTYSIMDINRNSIKINTYRVDNDEKIDETISIFK